MQRRARGDRTVSRRPSSVYDSTERAPDSGAARPNGHLIRVQEVRSGPPVIFVHGTSNGGSSWASVTLRVPKRRCEPVTRHFASRCGHFRTPRCACTLGQTRPSDTSVSTPSPGCGCPKRHCCVVGSSTALPVDESRRLGQIVSMSSSNAAAILLIDAARPRRHMIGGRWFFDVSVRQSIAEVPADSEHDHFGREPVAGER